MTDARDIDTYASTYSAQYGFEAEMVHYRRALVLDRLAVHSPQSVIEVGCGPDPLVVAWARRGGTWKIWHIVEPASAFVTESRKKIADAGLRNVEIHEAFFEDAGLEASSPDLVICAGLLHEVPSSLLLLRHLSAAMGPQTTLHVSVPNATSFHRRLALAMGLISDLHELSPRNTALDQRRVFDLERLTSELQASGLTITQTGGFLIKPFTHGQMEGLASTLGRDVLDGLDLLGRQNPEWASEIWAEATLA